MNTLFDLSQVDPNLPTIKLCCEGLDKLREAREFLLEHPELFDSVLATNDEVMTVAVKLDNMMARLRVRRAKLEDK